MRGFMKRLLCFVLIVAMLAAYAVPAYATEPAEVSFEQIDNSAVTATLPGREPVELPEEESPYADTDVVRVSIVLERAGTIEIGYSPINIAGNSSAMSYRDVLENEQASVVSKIESAINAELDVVWNLTLAANIISANVAFGQIEAIEQVAGVKKVIIETCYAPDVVSSGAADPNMGTSSEQIGSSAAWAAGYTGAGSKIAIIDTGADIEHEAFDAAAFEYSIDQLDTDADLFDSSDIAAVVTELNAYKRSNVSAEDLYFNSKIPYGFNYIDKDLDIVHVNDGQGEHGSHVAGIATANAYVNNGDGTFSNALETTRVQGVAPDAQLMVMKVFGKGGGAYDSDYMAAIEDAIVLGADSVNLSLGSGNPGMSRNDSSSSELGDYQDILDSLVSSGVVVAMSAGNSGYWSEASENGMPYLFLDDVSMQTDGSPGSYTNSFAVASVENDGFTGYYFKVGGNMISYNDNSDYAANAPMPTMAGTQEYVLVDAIGQPSDFAAVGTDVLEGKIVMCYRGTTSFFEKANAAVAAGAAGVIIVNNVDEIFGLILTDYEYTAPVVAITLSAGEYFKAAGTKHTTDSGITYWTGTMEVSGDIGSGQYNSDYYTMSSFSSWGVPGSLELKPEITAPGGNIYSVAGANKTNGQMLFTDHESYELMSGTSMASPQVAGMAAVMAQYIRETGLDEQTGLDERTLTQSLLMSTAVPMRDGASGGNYFPVIQQGAGLANVGAATMADSYILMDSNATNSYADGKVKAELGDDPDKDGVYSFSFTVNNLTGIAKDLVLSADVFTQDAFSQYDMLWMNTWTTDLNPTVSWDVDSVSVGLDERLEGKDFNGDNAVDADDGQALLDYATGLDVTLSNEDKADLNADGEINSYDAYLFFELLNSCSADLPAYGSADVTVTIDLSNADREWLAYYENGAYIEAYVNVETVATEEGVAGTAHSIPVLAFYGNWTDASMFDKGSAMEFNYGLETRPPYLYNSVFNKGNYNGLLVKYSDDPSEYWFGGNPMVSDETYMPERNAISAVRGDKISKIGFTSIRNAADSHFVVVNSETGEVYADLRAGAVPSAYYHVNQGAWMNTYMTLKTDFTPKGIADNTPIHVGLTLVPEYYVDENGNADLDALGEGATFSMPMVVDNTAPVLDEVDVDVENKVLTVSATDNQYISAVALFDISGQKLFTYTGSDADQAAGDTVEFQLDLSNVNGSSFLLQAYDYAMNVVTYEITTQIGEVTEAVEGIELDQTSLVMKKGSTATLNATVLPVNTTNKGIVWTTSDNSVVSVDENGNLTANAVGNATITVTSTYDETKYATCDVSVISLDFTVSGMLQDEVGEPMFFEWNMAEDETWTGGTAIDTSMTSATIDTINNKAYVMDAVADTWNMHLVDMTTGVSEVVGPNSAGVPLWDMEYSTYFSTADAPLVHGIYYYYFLPAKNPMALDTSAFGLSSYLANYTGAQYLVAITSAGYERTADNNGVMQDTEHIMMLDNAGYIWDFWIFPSATGYSALMNFAPTDLADYGLDFPGNGEDMYTSMVVGEDGKLYLSAYTGDYNELYQLTYHEAGYYSSMYLGNFEKDVWPAILTSVTSNDGSSVDSVAAPVPTMQMDAETFSVEELTASISVETEDAQSGSSSVAKTESKQVIVEVTAKDAQGNGVVSFNGVQTVTYDSDALTLVDVDVMSDYYSINPANGTVTIGYVDMEGFDIDETIATLVFDIKESGKTTVTVDHKEVNDQKPATKESFELEIEAEKVNPFTDVKEDKYYYDAVLWAVEKGITNGTTPTTFEPNASCTRWQVVTFLWRAAGCPEPTTTTHNFTDLSSSKHYYKAVLWAIENGITNGITETKFAPNQTCTRSQIVTFLWRYAGCPKPTNTEHSFTDVNPNKAYYEAMLWAVEEGITNGYTATSFKPNSPCTRAEIVTFLYRFMAD